MTWQIQTPEVVRVTMDDQIRVTQDGQIRVINEAQSPWVSAPQDSTIWTVQGQQPPSWTEQ